MLPSLILNFLSQIPCLFNELPQISELQLVRLHTHVFGASSLFGLVRLPPTVKFVWFNAACFSAA